MNLKTYQKLVLDLSFDPLLKKLSNPALLSNPDLGPVLYFGRLKDAKIVTVSINPSDNEFFDDRSKKPLTGSEKRFETLASLGRTDWNGLTQAEYDKIIYCCDNYFQINPYRKWFDELEKVINYSSYSYYDQKVSEGYYRAAHIDLFCWAAQPKWGYLPNKKADQDILMELGLPVLAELLKRTESPNLEKIVLNGKTTIDWFNKITNNPLDQTRKTFIKLSRKRVPQSVKCCEGTISQIINNDDSFISCLGRDLKVEGWSRYIQRAFAKVTPGPDKI